MCDICTQVRTVMKTGNTQENQTKALQLIGGRLKKAVRIDEHLSKLMDEVLGTGLVEEDQEKAGAWERSRRG